MPKIKSFAPSWLNEPSPGHKLFELSPDDARIPAALPYGKKQKPGPRRTIARRGTEVFVAAGKHIRWGDLAYIKDSWETKHGTRSASFDDDGAPVDGYRVTPLLTVTMLVNVARANTTISPSRRPSPMISASSSCPRTRTCSPS